MGNNNSIILDYEEDTYTNAIARAEKIKQVLSNSLDIYKHDIEIDGEVVLVDKVTGQRTKLGGEYFE